MKLTLCIVKYIVFSTYIINAFIPKQADNGLDNSTEYTILVCCYASYQIIGIKMSEVSLNSTAAAWVSSITDCH